MKKALEKFVNTGVTILRPALDAPDRTIVVLGAARGGTSLIAGLLHHMGIFMGERLDQVVYEDLDFSNAVESGDRESRLRLIRERDASHERWGWKRPASIDHLPAMHADLRNPHYIAVFRDIAAIATRNRLSMNSDTLVNMKQALTHYGRIVAFLESVQAPALLVSYEKALLNGDGLVEQIASFSGLSGEQIPAGLAEEFIRVNIPEYLDATRADRVIGTVGQIKKRVIRGWAMKRGDDSPVKVALYVNGKLRARIEADELRPDIKRRGLHASGKCGFEFRMKKNEPLADGDVVRVRVKGDVKDLRGTPMRFKA